MLAIKKSEKSTSSCAVNVLPCRIQHNGPVNASTRHWTPQVESNGKENSTSRAYFRGRKLTGKVERRTNQIETTGAILQKTDIVLPTTTQTPLDHEQEDQDSTPETKVLRQLATFDKITVYGHEVQPDAQEDVYVKGVNEWIGLAGAVSRISILVSIVNESKC
ncbi:hypothetical protein E4T48_05666 [Aureobasidium sp. EXF-10727]|nr:hypothetical protein E4T48_05666 [Aureobasidium sp. EXF-10727]